MELNQADRTALPAEPPAHTISGAARQCVIRDRHGRRIVMPRYTTDDAIEQIARAIAGRHASADEKRLAWERLRDEQGFTIEWIEAKRLRQL